MGAFKKCSYWHYLDLVMGFIQCIKARKKTACDANKFGKTMNKYVNNWLTWGFSATANSEFLTLSLSTLC